MLKKYIKYITLSQFIFFYAQCLASPINARVGVKAGVNHCVRKANGFQSHTGTGFHAGIDIGFDLLPCFAIDITPLIKSSQYKSPMWPGTDYEYMNAYLPTIVSFKLLLTPSLSPYLGIGGAVNFQLSGKMINTGDGDIGEQKIETLENDVYFVAVCGVEAKVVRLRISPELSFNYNLTPGYPGFEELSVSHYDLHFSVGLCYSFDL
jgi:hypothetical protein